MSWGLFVCFCFHACSLLLSLRLSFRGSHDPHVGHKAGNNGGEGVKGLVLHLEGLALLRHDLGDGGVVAVGHGREEVVLNLEVESAGEKGSNISSIVGRVLSLGDGPVRIYRGEKREINKRNKATTKYNSEKLTFVNVRVMLGIFQIVRNGKEPGQHG